jgi:uncharacterized protein
VHFVFDEAKSRANKEKHGIDFYEAQAIWLDPSRTHGPARSIGEQRHLVIGLVDGKCWSALVTYRGDVARLISVRRSRAKEVERYDLDK